MNIEKIGTVNYEIENGYRFSEDVGRGRLNGILIQGKRLFGTDDITVKVRTKEQTYVLLNNMKLEYLTSVSDQKYGIRGTDTLAGNLMILHERLKSAQIDGYISPANWEIEMQNQVRGLYIDLGHITLGNAELDFEFNCKPKATIEGQNDMSFYIVSNEPSGDYFLQYDETKDFDSTHHQVNEVYFTSKDPIVNVSGEYASVDFQIDTDRGTMITDLKGVLIATNIFSNLEIPEIYNARLYSRNGVLPETLRVKAVGANPDKNSLIFVKELIPKQVSDSTIENVKELRRKVEDLESKNSELAKRYRHLGRIVKSEDLAIAEQQMDSSDDE